MVAVARGPRPAKGRSKPANEASKRVVRRKTGARQAGSTAAPKAAARAKVAARQEATPRVTPEAYADQLRAEIIRRGRRIHKLTTASGISAERAAELQAAELKVCRSDFWYWLRNYAWFADPKSDDPRQLRKIPLLLWPAQEEILRFLLAGLHQKRDRCLNKSREIGATWLACALLYWLSAIAEEREGFAALAISRVEDLVDDGTNNSIFGKIRFQHKMQPTFLRAPIARDARMIVEFDKGGTIEGESTNSSAGRSGRYAVVLADEWAFVERQKQRPIALALASVARTWWRVSTPNGQGEDFHFTVERCRKHAPQDLLEIPWQADPRRTQEWYESILVENGGEYTYDERAQNFACSFAAVSGTRIFRADRAKLAYSDAWLEKNFPDARAHWPSCWPMDFGSGLSWTVTGPALVSWDHGKDMRHADGSVVRLPLILVDRELVWQRVSVADIAREILEVRAGYSGLAWHFGDPAGTAAESDQESWQSNLNAAGVPIVCLPGVFNTATLRDQSIIEAQMLMDLGLFRVHETRCPLLMKAIEIWEWELPAGIDERSIQFMSRDMLKPRKDGWSHVGDALILYLVSALLRIGRAAFDSTGDLASVSLPNTPAAEVNSMLDRSLRDRLANSGGAVIEEDVEEEYDPLGAVGIDWR